MKNIFVDTNIIVDLLTNRPPFSSMAIRIFHHAEKNQIKLYTSSHSFATTHYLLKKYTAEIALRNLLLSLLDFITIIPVDTELIKNGLLSNHKDFEDAIQILAADRIDDMNYIVTRNVKDFKKAKITVVTPEELLNILK